MAMTKLKPNSRDIADAGLAISCFPNAFGCVQPDGTYRESIDSTNMWMMIPTTPEEMAAVWKRTGISTGDTFSQMLASKERRVTFIFYKVSRGWFKTAWIGNASLDFDSLTVFIGSTAGQTQAEIWSRFRSFLDGPGSLQDSPAAALAAIS
jgi:hypothetical protein